MQGCGRIREVPLLIIDSVLPYSSGEPRGIRDALESALSPRADIRAANGNIRAGQSRSHAPQ
jgi:hypothetical protein